MLKFKVLSAALAFLAIAAATAGVHASGHRRTLVVTMTNDQDSNEIKVYDAESHVRAPFVDRVAIDPVDEPFPEPADAAQF